jgi:membrane protein YqaA with SNARE-associated domain
VVPVARGAAAVSTELHARAYQLRLRGLWAAVRMNLTRAAGLSLGGMASAALGYAPLRKSKRRGCGTGDQHRLWLNTDACGVMCALVVWVLALYSHYVFTVREA